MRELEAQPFDISSGWFQYVNIYTKSPVIEQTTPASLLISDTVACPGCEYGLCSSKDPEFELPIYESRRHA